MHRKVLDQAAGNVYKYAAVMESKCSCQAAARPMRRCRGFIEAVLTHAQGGL